MPAMSLISSAREKRLWAWTLIVVLTIYASLGLELSIASILIERGLVTPFYIVGMLLIVATAVSQGFRLRPRGLEVAVALGIVAAYLLLLTRLPIPEERTHLIEYGIVGAFIYEALLERRNNGRAVYVPAILAVIAASMLGIIDECFQYFLPNRIFDLRDMVFNVLAATMAVSACKVMAGVRRPGAPGSR